MSGTPLGSLRRSPRPLHHSPPPGRLRFLVISAFGASIQTDRLDTDLLLCYVYTQQRVFCLQKLIFSSKINGLSLHVRFQPSAHTHTHTHTHTHRQTFLPSVFRYTRTLYRSTFASYLLTVSRPTSTVFSPIDHRTS